MTSVRAMLKLSLCLAFLSAICVAVEVPGYTDEQLRTMYEEFLKEYPEKRLSEPNEATSRFDVWKGNLNYINQHNAEAAQGLHTYTLGMNRFGDWTNEQYRARMLTYRKQKSAASHTVSSRVRVYTPSLADIALAANTTAKDWRDDGAVNAVKDQQDCGSCWAFSATATLEGAYWQANGELKSFSEQMCVDCANGGDDTCDRGGIMYDCYNEVIRRGGEQLEDDYPYEAVSGTCRYVKGKRVGNFTQYYNVTSGSESALLTASTAHPIIAIAIDASSNAFQLYKSGVYTDNKCGKTEDDLDHGVALVGFGRMNNTDYWIVRNSWGNKWGQSGYIYMKRGINQCGITLAASFAVANADASVALS